MANYGVLPQAQEDALHPQRLLNVEEKPFARLTRSLLSNTSLLRTFPSPPSEPTTTTTTSDRADPTPRLALAKFHDEIHFDFAALESSILRIQALQTSNHLERQRYAAEKAKILSTAQAVRDNTVELRVQLGDAQKVLEQRKGYDVLAEKILNDKKTMSRADAEREIEKLEKEIEELQVESEGFEGVWVQRRELFERVVGEGEATVRVIKGIKEVDAEEEEEEGEGEEATKDGASRTGSPGPLDGRTPLLGGDTPLPDGGAETGEATPARPTNRFLDIDDSTRSGSRAASPARRNNEAISDVEMAELHDDGVTRAEDTAVLAVAPSQATDATSADAMDET